MVHRRSIFLLAVSLSLVSTVSASSPIISDWSFENTATDAEMNMSLSASDPDRNLENVFLNLSDAEENLETTNVSMNPVTRQFGEDSLGNTDDTYSDETEFSNQIVGSWFEAPSDGVPDSVTAYTSGSSFKAMIYRKSDGLLVANSSERQYKNVGWYTVEVEPYKGRKLEAGEKYWIVTWGHLEAFGNYEHRRSYDSGIAGKGGVMNESYGGNPPEEFNPSLQDRLYSAYLTYSTGDFTYSTNIGAEPSNVGSWSLDVRAVDELDASSSNSSTFTVYDGTNPLSGNLKDNASSLVRKGAEVNISAEFWDNDSGLSEAILATNESGDWLNKTSNHNSPHIFDGETRSFETADFIWSNSSVTGSLSYRVWGKDQGGNWNRTGTQNLEVNQPPNILGATLNWNSIGEDSETRDIQYSISDPNGNHIGSHNSPPSGSAGLFTNSTYRLDDISFPFSYTAMITDFAGGSSSESTDISTSDSGYQERIAYEHSVDSQRIERTAGITNNGDSFNYTLSMAEMGTVIQGGSWSGSLGSGNSISKTSIWEGDYITGETEETYSKYSDGDYDHTEDSQRIHNRTKLLADNSRSFTFHDVDISSICSRTSIADISAASGFLVTDDCNRPTFTGDWISETVSQEYPDSSHSHTLDTQKIEKNKTLSEDGGYSWSQIDISPPTISGDCTDCSTRTRDLPSLGSVEEVYHATSDWITGGTLGTYNKYSDADFSHGEDTQRIHNRTELLVDNTRSFEFHGVDISEKCSQSSSGNISSGTGVRVTDDCTRPIFQVDVINESTSTLFEDTGFSHTLSSQGVAKSKTLSETGGYDFIGVNVSSPALPGSVQNGGMREVNLSSGDSATEFYNSTGDWIQNEKEREHIVGQDYSQFQTVDVQQLYNQTRLEADNTRSFGFPAVDLISTCSITQSAAVPSGSSTVTTSCNNKSSSGDWIKNEESGSAEYASGPVFIGEGFNKSFTATQRVEAANVRPSTDLQVNVDSLVSDTPGCSVVNSSQQTFSADSVSSFTFYKSCNPGSHVNRTPVLKTESSEYFKYEAEFNFKVNSDLTEEQDFRYAVKKEWVDQWNSRDPTQTEVAVDGSSKDISIKETIIDGTEYIVFVIGDEHGNSSVHKGTHSASLRYFESKSPGSTSGTSGGSGGSSGGGLVGGSGSETQVEEVTSDKYNWSASAITSEDSKSFQISGYPGATFEKYIVVRNTGDSNVTLDVDCTSLEDQCSWVDVEVDRVVLNRNSFSEKTIAVSGTVPESFSERDSPVQFSIQVSDPEFNGSQSGPHVGYVDFTVTDDPFLGRALDVALKGFEVREFESPGYGLRDFLDYRICRT